MGESILQWELRTLELDRTTKDVSSWRVAYSLPHGRTFEMEWTARDFEYLPRLVAKFEEFARNCGFDYFKLRRASETDHTDHDWSEKLSN